MSVLWKNDQSAPSNYSLTCLPFPNRVQLQQQVWCCQAPLCCHTTVLIYLPNQIETWLPVSSSPLLPLLQKLAGLTRPSILISFCSYFQCPDGTRCASATCAHKQVPCRLTCHTLEAASCCSKIWWSPPEAAWQSPCSKKNFLLAAVAPATKTNDASSSCCHRAGWGSVCPQLPLNFRFKFFVGRRINWSHQIF
jgi:hypothetical protein